MGANRYEWSSEEAGRPAIGIGRDCIIRNAILDLDTRIGDGVQLVNAAGIQEADSENYAIRGGGDCGAEGGPSAQRNGPVAKTQVLYYGCRRSSTPNHESVSFTDLSSEPRVGCDVAGWQGARRRSS